MSVVRHGQTEWNIKDYIQGWKDSPLTEKGIEQAKKLGERIAGIQISCIYSSSSGRAYQTAVHLRRNQEVQIVKTDKLREISLSAWEGRKWSEIEKLYPNELELMKNQPERFEAQETQGETFYDVQDRLSSFIEQLLKKHKNGNILLVTHSITMKVLVNYFRGTDMRQLWEGPDSHWASLYELRISRGQVTILFEGKEIGKYPWKEKRL